jgi:hypothetical protein
MMSASTPTAEHSSVADLSLDDLLWSVWQSKSERDPPTPLERRAVERYVSQHYSSLWCRKKILNEGLDHCLEIVHGAPNKYGLS